MFFYFRVTNSKLKNKKLHFKLLTQSQKLKKFILVTNSIDELSLFHFRVTNSKLKNKKLQLQLLTRWLNFYFFAFELLNQVSKIKNFTSSYQLDGRTFILSHSSYKCEVDKWKNSLNIAVSWSLSTQHFFLDF